MCINESRTNSPPLPSLFHSTRLCPSSWLRWRWRWSWQGWHTSGLPGRWIRGAETHISLLSPRPLLEISQIRWPLMLSRCLEAMVSTVNTLWRSWWGMPRSTRWVTMMLTWSLQACQVGLQNVTIVYFFPLQIYEGTAQIQRLIIAREHLGKYMKWMLCL